MTPVAAVTLPTAVWLTPDVSRVYRQAVTLQKETAEFNAELARLLNTFQDIINRSQSGQISDAEVVTTLRTSMLPAWNFAVERLARVEIDRTLCQA